MVLEITKSYVRAVGGHDGETDVKIKNWAAVIWGSAHNYYKEDPSRNKGRRFWKQ